MKPRQTPKWVAALLFSWLAVIAVGFALFESYHARPGDPGRPSNWPSGCPWTLDPVKPTLVLFLHPLCPCSASSIDELASIRADWSSRFAAHVVVYEPPGPSTEWQRATPARDADSLAGWQRWSDRGGDLAQRFGVRTSGHVLLFDPRGGLLYSGGVTPGRGRRGQAGDLDELLDGIEGGKIVARSGPVYGCLIRAEEGADAAGGTP